MSEDARRHDGDIMQPTEGPQPPHGDGWHLRAYRDGDEHRIAQQFESIFQRRMSPEMWRWKLKTFPSTVENVWLAVDEDDRPVFQYAAEPRRLRFPGGTADVLVLVDLWTDPKYRRRRIFTTCAEWVHDYWRRSGIAGVLSPFNAREEPRYTRFGWEYLFPLRWQIRPLRPEAIAARRLRIAGLEHWRWVAGLWNRFWDRGATPTPGLEIREIADAEDPASLELANPGKPSIVLEHDAAWVEWRYLACPHLSYFVLEARRDGRPAGHLAYRVDDTDGRRFGFVSELISDGPDVESALIDAAITRLAEHSVVAIATLATPGTDLFRAWRRRGFLFSWGRFCVHWLPLRRDPAPELLRDPQAWEMVGGDYDVI